VHVESEKEKRCMKEVDNLLRKANLEKLMEEKGISEERKIALRKKFDAEFGTQIERKKLSLKDFQTVKIIGRGAFGEVHYIIRYS